MHAGNVKRNLIIVILLNRSFFGIETGLPRTHEEHKSNAVKSIMASTPTEWNNIESENDSRFSELMHLPYNDYV